MLRRLFLSLAICTMASTMPLTPLRGQAIPIVSSVFSPSSVVGLIDSLTRRDSATVGGAKFGATLMEGKLLVARTKVEINLERSSCNWRGRVVTTIRVPTEITYTVDLRAIQVEHVRIDRTAHRVTIIMPPPCVEDIVPMLSAVQTDDQFRAARSKHLDRKTVAMIQNDLLRKDYDCRARTVAKETACQVREQARQAVADLLGQWFAGTGLSIQIIVN